MNTEFGRMKVGSEKLNSMTKDIRWCVSTVLGMVNGVCKNKNIPIFSVRKEVGTNPKDFDQYFVEVRMDANREVSIVFIDEDSPGRSMDRKISEQWDPDEIKLVHGNLDAVIEAARDFCREADERFGWIAFDNSMKSLTYVLD